MTCDQGVTDKTWQFTTVQSAPFLIITKADWPDPVARGKNLTYTISYENSGNMNATNVIITERYDTNVTFVNATPAPAPGNTTWTIGTLPPDGKHYINITVRVNDAVTNGTVLNNYVNITCDEGVEEEDAEDTEIGEPVLVVTKYDYPDPVDAGGILNYTIMFENLGNVTATNTTVNDTLPPEVTFISASPTPNETYNDNHTLVWNIGNLPPNDLRTITVTVAVHTPLTSGSKIVDYVNISSSEGPGNDTEETTVLSAPVLEIEKFDSPDPVQAGGTLNYTIRVNNTGNANATNVNVTETYDPNVSFVSSTPAPTSGNNTWTFPTLNASESKAITITVTVNTPLLNGTVLHNFVNVSCDEGIKDETWQNTPVGAAPLLTITKSDSPDPVQAGETLNYTILVNNTGNMNASNVIVTDVYDANVTFVSSVPSPDDANNNTWTFPTINASESKAITITVNVKFPLPNGTILHNFADVSCEEGISDHALQNTTVQSEPIPQVPVPAMTLIGKIVLIALITIFMVNRIKRRYK